MSISLLPPRERILQTAARLFYAQGVRATGIDQIIAEAGVAKATLYYHFPAKTHLVSAYLQHRHEAWLAEFTAYLTAGAGSGLAPLADALERWFQSGQFNGCAFINVTAESTDPEWRHVSCAHKESLRLLIARRLPSTVPATRCAQLSAQALLILEGMIVRYQMTDDLAVVTQGRELLRLLESTIA